MLFMSFDMTYEISTTSSEATQSVAERLARLLQGGEVIELTSDLGGGKTTFVQGLASGLGYEGEVTSPTFTLSRVYKLKNNLELHHYDLYRLGQSGVVGDVLAEDVGDRGIITIIEWAGIVADQLPHDRLRIEFTVTGDTDRLLQISSHGPVSHRLAKGLQS
jgi:tRNA threonylcarbamoyladenosine biosynthesis protein TsaE